MADEPFITRKDLEEVTQKVAIHNSKDLTKPLIDQQKNNDLKELERSIEQRSLFQSIADGIKDLSKSLLEGLKGLIPKDGSSFAQVLAFGAAGVATMLGEPLKDLRNTFALMKKRLKNSRIGKSFSSFFDKFKNFFKNIFRNLEKSKIGSFLKNNKAFIAIGALFTKVFGKGGFFSGLSGIFNQLKKAVTSGPLKSIFGMIGSGGAKLFKLLGKIFWPLTIIFGVIDFYNGFKKGFSEGGIIEGIKQGIQELFDGLVGGILRILSWIPENIAKLFGLNKLSKAVGEYTETLIKSIKDVFGGLVDLLVGIFTWDTNKMGGALEDIWDGIVKLVLAPFVLMGEAIEDIFNFEIGDLIQPLQDGIDSIFQWFIDLGEKIKEIFSLENMKKLAGQLGDFLKSLIPGLGGGKEEKDPTTSSIYNPHKNRALHSLGGPRATGMHIPSHMASTNNNNNSTTIINNHNFNTPSNLGVEVMQRAFS